MIVLRVENENLKGPYTSGHGHLLSHHDDLDTWPPPSMDGVGEVWYSQGKLTFKCGFLNEAQLYNWFNQVDLNNLAKVGYNLVAIDVDVVAIGKNQVLFNDTREMKWEESHEEN